MIFPANHLTSKKPVFLNLAGTSKTNVTTTT